MEHMLVEPCSALKSVFTPFSSVIGWNKINPDDHHICVTATYGWRGNRASQTFISSVATHHQRGRKSCLLDLDSTEEETKSFPVSLMNVYVKCRR